MKTSGPAPANKESSRAEHQPGSSAPPGDSFEQRGAVIDWLQQDQATAQIGVWHLDPQTGLLTWSDEMFRIYGCAGRGRPEDCLATVLADDVQATHAAFAEAQAQRKDVDLLHRVQPPGGALRHVRVQGRFTYAADGSAIRAMGTAQDVTGMVDSQAAGRASAARWRAWLNSMAEGMVVHGMDGRVVDANPAACVILGLSRDQILGVKPIDSRWQALHEDGTTWPGLEHPAMMALRTGLPQHGKVMGVHTPQGGLRWITINACPIREEGCDATSGVVATFVDITAQRRLEASLAQNAQELADLYDNAPCGYHSLDASGRFVRINATELSWLGCTREEVLGTLGPADFFTDEGKAVFRQQFPRLLRGESLAGVEHELVGRNGSRRWVSVTASAIHAADGRFVGTRSVLHDITDLRRARDELKRINAEQAAVLGTGLAGIARVRQRHFVWVSEGAARMFGYAAEELVGQPTRVIYASDEDYASVARALPPDRRPGQQTRLQLEMLRKDGSRVWIDLSSELLSVESGESLGVFVDITPLKRAEAARIRLAQLDAENAQLMEVSRQRDQFLAHMSHELRTPLNAVTGYAHLLKKSAVAAESPKLANYIHQIGESGRQLLSLVQDMLDFGRATSGTMMFSAQTLSVRAVLDEVAEALEPRCVAARLEWRMVVDPALRSVVNDPLRLRQMLLNLADNAVKFSRPGGVVSLRAQGLDAERWSMEVEDQGIGIAADDLERIFAPLVQLSAGSTKAYAGAGIGLALVRKIARAQGGDVQVRSRQGEGSVFSLVLPRVPAGLPGTAAG